MADTVDTPDLVAPRPEVRAPGRSGRGVRITQARSLLGTVPFFAYVTIFLIIPTLVVVIGAFAGDGGGFTLANLSALTDSYILDAFGRSIAAVRGHRR